MEDLNAKDSRMQKSQLTYQWAVRVGKTHRKAYTDARKRILGDLWRSDAVTCVKQGIIKLTQRQKSAES
jgi:hypothetical protein